jgi:hypothetical protein
MEEFGFSTYAYQGQEHLSQSPVLNSTNVELEEPSAERQPSSSVFLPTQYFIINVVTTTHYNQII